MLVCRLRRRRGLWLPAPDSGAVTERSLQHFLQVGSGSSRTRGGQNSALGRWETGSGVFFELPHDSQHPERSRYLRGGLTLDTSHAAARDKFHALGEKMGYTLTRSLNQQIKTLQENLGKDPANLSKRTFTHFPE